MRKDNKQMSTTTENKELSNFQNRESHRRPKMEMRVELTKPSAIKFYN